MKPRSLRLNQRVLHKHSEDRGKVVRKEKLGRIMIYTVLWDGLGEQSGLTSEHIAPERTSGA